MNFDKLVVSRRGEFVVLNHQEYQIEYNLSKGTWNYKDKTGKTIIKNGFTQINLSDGTAIKTLDDGYRKFLTEPMKTDAYGISQTLKFSYETIATYKQRQSTSNKNTDKENIHPTQGASREITTEKSNVSEDTGIRIYTYLTCYADHPYILLKVRAENTNTKPILISNITLIDISGQYGSIQLGGHPSQYHLLLKMPPISPSASVRHKIYDGFELNQDNTLQPCQEGILYDTDSKRSFVFGFLTAKKWWPRMHIGYKIPKRKTQQGLTKWSLYNDCENMECQSGEAFSSEIGYLDFSDEAHTSLERYTERIAAEHKVHTLQSSQHISTINDTPLNDDTEKTVTGWTFSTENIQEQFSAKSIKEQTDFIAKSPIFNPNLSGGIEYIQLENGWQQEAGYLSLSKEDFPDGMSAVVEQLHADGFKAGICIDPFCIDMNSELIKKFPDACLRFKKSTQTNSKEIKHNQAQVNEPIEVYLPGREKALTILDASHPEAQKHIRKVVTKLVNEWSFDLIKADFSSYTCGLMAVAPNAKWYEKTLTSTELYQHAICLMTEVIESTKKDVLLAGYNVIECASIGSFQLNYPLLRQKNVDNNDTWHQQNGTKHRLSRYTGYLNSHNTLWHQIYGELTVDQPRPVNEAIVEMTAAALSGAAVLCANTPNMFSTQRAELVAKLFPLSGIAATSVDHFDEPCPQILHLPVITQRESWDLIGIFNWKDQQNDVHLNLEAAGLNSDKDYLVHDFWMRQYLGVVSKNVTLLNIAPRSAKLLCFRKEQPTPQLLSTDIHYMQGSVEILSAGWDEYSQSYLIVCQPPRSTKGTLFIHVPEEYIPIGVSAFGSDYQYSWDKPIYQLTFNATDSLIQASIQFMKTTGSSSKP